MNGTLQLKSPILNPMLNNSSYNSIFYPPGGILLWIIIFLELVTFGMGMGENTFFTFYWLLTGFHFVHVLVALVILTWTWIKMKSQKSSLSLLDLEAAAAFWHMCDLIWLLLFPALYLIW